MTATPWTTTTPPEPDIQLVVCDMDGTLLDPSGQVPREFWPLLETMDGQGITFVPASGRQLATLERIFATGGNSSFIAENGTMVVHRGEVISTTTLADQTVTQVIELVRGLAGYAGIGLVLCGVDSAYVEDTDPTFLAEAGKYYAHLEIVPDLKLVKDQFLKLAVCDFHGAEARFHSDFTQLAEQEQVVVSGELWIDIMRSGVHKGQGVRALQRALGITAENTVAFGDYLNDLQMLDTAEWSFAMANAHPRIREQARFLAPGNDENGVVTVLSELLERNRIRS